MITIIAPHARPRFTNNLLANFKRQQGVGCRLVVVANDEARDVGGWPGEVIVIRSDKAHQADAMNTGLAWLRAEGGGRWARFDDDDYYGPGYMAAVEESLRSEELVVSGMPWRFVMLDDGLHQFQADGDFTGGSLAASTADVEPFPLVSGDDMGWCRSMRARGALFVERKAAGYCYDRTTRLAPRVIEGNAVMTRLGFGPSLFYGQLPVTAVDRSDLVPLCEKPRPGDEEVFAALYQL